MLAFVAGLYVLALRQGLPEADARALTFTPLVATNLGLVLVNRAHGEHFWAGLRRGNTALWCVTGGTAVVLAAIMAMEPARRLFHFGPLHADDAAVAVASGVLVLMFLALADRIRTSGRTDGLTLQV